ncbi:MAG: DegT/DnrJ/EryC1/StrS family aminotransferase [Firmicutes bacterium]|nr:DegT/DnrJ/EryC1/StrS family aminotransferase [Bacillota bacterium]
MSKNDVTTVKGAPIHGQDVFPGGENIGEEEKRAVVEVIESKSLFRYYGLNLLNKVKEFEQEFAKTMGVKYALGVSSGTGALYVAMNALGIGPGDEVIVPGYTFIASMEVIPAVKAIPVICDINESLNLDPEEFERRITPRTKAVVVVHMRGIPADMDPILEIARRHNIKVLEDCAQATGASYKGKRVGSMGDIAAFSLQYHKIITSGEGGVVATNDFDLYKRAIRFHDHGYMRFEEYGSEEQVNEPLYLGLNFRMSELVGALALAQLRKLDSILTALRRNKAKIMDGIRDIRGITFRKIPDPSGEAGSTIVFFTDSAEKTARFAEMLNAKKVAAFIPYYSGPHVYAHWRQLLEKAVIHNTVKCPFEGCPHNKSDVKYEVGMLPKTDDILKRAIHIDVSPFLTDEAADQIISAIRSTAEAVL